MASYYDSNPAHADDFGARHMPSPEEIAEVAAKIRDGWTEKERIAHAVAPIQMGLETAPVELPFFDNPTPRPDPGRNKAS